MTRIIVLAALIIGALACKQARESSSQAEPPAAPTGQPAAEPGSPEPAASRDSDVTIEAVQALLERWLAAQNEQDFAAYESLYASRFEGVRRSGPRVVRMDRAGWIADRKRMFQRPMRVEAREVRIDPFAGGAAVLFTQRWASGKYEDIGPKQMVIVREGEALRIAREEMLASRIIAGAARETGLADAGFAFVIQAGGASYVVLDTTEATPESLELVSDGDPVVVKGKIREQDLSLEVASWKGATVRASECVARVVDLAIISRVHPHFGTRQEWSGELDGEAPYTRQEIARSAYTPSGAVIAGRLDSAGSCMPRQFVRKDDQPAALFAQPVADAAMDEAALRAFRSLPSYKDIQNEYADSDEGKGGGPWDGHEGARPVVKAYRHPGTGVVLVVVRASAGVGCGEFHGSLTALFRVRGSLDKPGLELLGEPGIDTVVDVFDLEGDGAFELLVTSAPDETSLITQTGELRRNLTVPFFDCGC